MINEETHSFIENGQKYMQCKSCYDYKSVEDNIVSFTCSTCTILRTLKRTPLEEMIPSLKKKKTSGRPAGWHFMNEFVDKDGTVYHKGKEQPKLKGTLKPTVVKQKKNKRRTKEQILIDRHNKKKVALRKAVKKQKDFLNHKLGG